ncbi:MAG: LamG-like jellyroll fold domain-containing protein [Thalassotalea sp.]
MSNDKQIQRFEELLSLLLDTSLTGEQFEELIILAEHDEALKAQLRDQLNIDHLLYQNAESKEILDTFVNATLELAAVQKTSNEFETNIITAIRNEKNKVLNRKASKNKLKTFKHYYFPWILSGLSMAACALLSIQYFHSPIDPFTEQDTIAEYQYTGVAVIANVLSLDRSSPFKTGDIVQAGELIVSHGFLELEFYRGAQLKIAGPTTINIIDEEHIQLLSGKVMTDVPKVAIGFTIDTPNSEIIDLGTEIGVEVLPNGQSNVHVFEGLVEARSKQGDSQLIEKDQAVKFSGQSKSSWFNSPTLANDFAEFKQIDDLTGNAVNVKHQKWLLSKNNILKNPNLVTYYDFEPDSQSPRVLNNLSKYGNDHNGAIVGAQWSDGPWKGKHALNFKQASDRVRIDIDNKLTNFTLAAWVQIDSLDRKFNSILLTDGFSPGDIHWQISNFSAKPKAAGSMVLGLKSLKNGSKNYRYAPFFTPEESGTWYHLVMRFYYESDMLAMFINGEKVKETKITNPSKYWQIGSASIGNWDNTNTINPLRNLNGSIAEMVIFSSALDDNDIKTLALTD